MNFTRKMSAMGLFVQFSWFKVITLYQAPFSPQISISIFSIANFANFIAQFCSFFETLEIEFENYFKNFMTSKIWFCKIFTNFD